MALLGGGKKAEGCLVYDFAFRHCHPNGVDLLLLIKARLLCRIEHGHLPCADFIQAVVLFMAGEHDDAKVRIDALITTVRLNSVFYTVRARTNMLPHGKHYN